MTVKLTNFQKVQEFSSGFDVARTDNPDEKLFKLRWDLIQEESDELFQALKDENYVEILDAVSDILYVVLGASDSFNKNFDEMCDSSFSLKISLPDTISLMPFSKYRMQVIFDEQKDKLSHLQNDYSTAIQNLKNAFASRDVNEIVKKLVPVHTYLYEWAYMFGFDLDETFNLVHDSNMSKLAETEEIAKNTVEWYKINETRYDSPSYRLSPIKVNGDDRWIIFNSSTGKVLKSINYHAVDLSKYIDKFQ
jgi:predicted HAD superfamily Cof-like phosphohydrolase